MRQGRQVKSTLLDSPYFDEVTEVTIARRWEDRFADRWESAEPTFIAVLGRLRRAAKKLRQRARWVFLAFLIGTVAVTAHLRVRKPYYWAHVTFRVKDSGTFRVEATDTVLQQSIRLNYLTYGRLLSIIEQHNLYPNMHKRAPYLAVESFREDIWLEAQRYEQEGGSQKPLHITIAYLHSDPDIAKTVARELADVIVGESRAALGAKHVLALKQTRDAADVAFRHASGIYRIQGRETRVADPQRAQRIEDELQEALRNRAAAELRATEDLANHSYEFMSIDAGVHAQNVPMSLPMSFVLGILLSAFSVCVIAILLGAGTELVMDEMDIRALHMTPLITVPSRS